MAEQTADLRVIGASPFNAETRFDALAGFVTPPGRHYVRNHFQVPAHEGLLHIDGRVRRPVTIRVAELAERAAAIGTVTLECAGNGRAALLPPAPGEQWGTGAAGTAEWSGVPLAAVLADAGVAPDASELVFAGADEGLVGAVGRVMHFERSMPVADVERAFVVTGMAGRPLTANHGAPVRLLVPGRYGMASVKWLSRITAVREPFRGFFQVDRYVIDGRPLGDIAPRAVIASPVDGSAVAAAGTTIRGYAWAGRGPIARVEVSTDGGATWTDATLGPIVGPRAWREWSLPWQPDSVGETPLLARATDADGTTQPVDQVRNDLGYANNAAQSVRVTVS